MALETSVLAPGTRIRVTQQMPQTHTVWSTALEGTVVRWRQARTGSWYAHGRDDKLWLDRLGLRRPDGEMVTLNLDQYSLIETLD